VTQNEFDQDTAVHRLVDGRFTAEITDRWNTPGGPDGGYVLAIAGRALAVSLPHPHPFTVNSHFLRRAIPGPAELEVEVVRAGRRHSTGHVRVLQEGKEILRALGTFGDLSAGSGRSMDDEPPPNLPPPEESIDAWEQIPAGGRFPIGERTEGRFAELPGWFSGELSGVPMAEYYQRFRDGRHQDPLSLLFMSDAAPPSTIEIGELGSVTLELTVHVRALPAQGWLTMRKVGSHVTNGYFQEDVTMWDSSGKVVASSRQLAMLPGGF
jgi:acyl-CoA thioesterase